jgi:ABC-type oligopeptide transport system substrate-binding subunit
MAESWEVSEDGKVYTFHLRDAVWSDGAAVTSDDFIYTYQSMADPLSGATNGWLFDGLIENFTESLYNDGSNPEYDKKPQDIGVAAPDDKTVVFTLTRSAPFFLELVASPKPLRRDKAEEWGDSYGSSAETIVTNGAFKIDSWTQNVEMTLVKNEEYWNAENVKLDRIERKVLQDTATSVQALLSGDIHTMGTSDPNWQKMIEESGGFYEMPTSTRAPEFLAFHCSNEYFKHPKIRMAFSLAINRDKFIEEVMSDLGDPIETLMPSVIYVGETTYTELVDGANEQIIQEWRDKYPNPKDLLIEGLTEAGLDPDPANMQVRYASRGTAEISKKIAEWYYQQFQEILGVTITIDMMEWNIMWDMIDQGNYDIATSGWGPYYNDPEALLGLFHMENGFFSKEKSGWSDADAERFAELVTAAREASTAEEKAPIYLEAEKLLVGTGVIAPVYLPKGFVYIANQVHDLTFNPNAYTDYNKVYID